MFSSQSNKSLSASAKQAFDGGCFCLCQSNNNDEPRLQINEDLTTQRVFGVEVDEWSVGPGDQDRMKTTSGRKLQ
jgi:hypothetical protein